MPRGASRVGAGRRSKEPKLLAMEPESDSDRFLVELMSSDELDLRLLMDAAKTLAATSPYDSDFRGLY